MPTEMLQTEATEKDVASPAPPSGPSVPGALPARLLTRGPDFLRRPAEGSQPRRLSAVERLEADKSKYVKSQVVINAKQEPIRAALPQLSPPGTPALPPGPRRASSSLALRSSNNNGGKPDVAVKRANLNLEILCNLLNSPEGCFSGPGNRARSWAPQRSRSSELHRRSFAESLRVFPTHGANLNLTASLLQEQACPGPTHLSLSSSDLRLSLRPKPGRPAHQAPPLRPNMASEGHAPHPPGPPRLALTRSKSDLSERYARAGADVERFFNYCGLDPGELEGLGVMEGFAHVNADIISLNLRSASMISSEYERSLHSNENLTEDQDSEERVPYGVSAVERNARVIKWLYSIKQARVSQKVSHV